MFTIWYKRIQNKTNMQYTIETFTSMGTEKMIKSHNLRSNHYMLNYNSPNFINNKLQQNLKSKCKSVYDVRKWIFDKRSTLARQENPGIIIEYSPPKDIKN